MFSKLGGGVRGSPSMAGLVENRVKDNINKEMDRKSVNSLGVLINCSSQLNCLILI